MMENIALHPNGLSKGLRNLNDLSTFKNGTELAAELVDLRERPYETKVLIAIKRNR